MAIPPLVLRIYADSSGVKKGVAQAQTQVGGLKGFLAKNSGLMKEALVGGLVAGIAVSVKAAGDLGEAINATDVTFKDSAQIVKDWAKDAADSAGLAKAEALQAASGIGAMFDSAGIAGDAAAKMAVDVSQLAGDIASLRNADPTEMLERMRAGLAGEAEPLRRFGIFISDARVKAEAYESGIAKVGQELTDAQKIQARYNIILADSEEAQGDFARTVGTSLPNQIRKARAQLINLSATFGRILLPVVSDSIGLFTDLLGPLADAADGFADISAKAQEAGEDIGGWQGEVVDKLPLIQLAFQALAPSYTSQKNMIDDIREAQEKQNAIQGRGNKLWEIAGGIFERAQNWLHGTGVEYTRLGVKIHQFSSMTRQQQTKWAGDLRENFSSVQTALDNLATKARVTAEKIITAFTKQAENIRNYRENLETVAKRNIPDVILQQLVDMGLEGAGIMAELAGASDRKFNQMVRAMKRARTEDQKLLQDLRDLRREAEEGILVNIRFQMERRPDLNLGQRQGGGAISAQTPYLVGERGPEIIVPRDGGKVLSNDHVGGGQTIVVKLGDETLERVVVKGLNRAAART